MARHNPALYALLMKSIGVGEKRAFVPTQEIQPQDPTLAGGMAQQQGAPPVDPATGMPMDPAMAGGAAGAGAVDPATGMPMDPAMAAGGDPAAAMAGGGAIPPELMAMLSGGGDPMAAMAPDGLPADGAGGGGDSSDIKEQIKQVLEETGVIKPKKMKPDEQYQYLITMLERLLEHMGIDKPEPPAVEGEGGEGSEANPAAGGMGAGSSGQASNMSLGSLSSPSVGGGGASPSSGASSGGSSEKQSSSPMTRQLAQTMARLRSQ